MQTQQVLDNLARLDCDPAANPSHLNLTTGLVQATDQKTGTLLGSVLSAGLASNNVLTPSVSLQRGLVEQWSVNPVTGDTLEGLRIVYKKALHPEDPDVNDDIVLVQREPEFSLRRVSNRNGTGLLGLRHYTGVSGRRYGFLFPVPV